MTLSVAIVEDQRDIRESLAQLIGGTPGFACTGTFRSMEDALRAFESATPDVALVDIGLPGMSGIEGIRVVRERWPSVHPLVLSVYEDDERIFDALCAGAVGYLLKRTPAGRLLEALKDVSEGGSPMSPEVARRVLRLFREIRPPERSVHDLTPHEHRILTLLVEGHSYKTAAARLGITVKTVSFHLQRIYEKLQVHSKSEAVAKALRNRIVR